MDHFLNGAIGDNSKLLVDLLRSLKKEENVLSGQLTRGGVAKGTDWQEVVGEVQATLLSLEQLEKELAELTLETSKIAGGTGKREGVEGGVAGEGEGGVAGEGEGGVAGESEGGVAGEEGVAGEGAGVWRDVRLCVEELGGMVEEVRQVDQLDRYLVWLQYLQQLCVAMERGLGDGGGPGVGAVAPYVKLRSACETLSGSGCHHLRVWVRDCQHYWRHRLTLNLSRHFSNLLEEVGWPLTTPTSLQQEAKWEEKHETFQKLFRCLLELDIPDSSCTSSTANQPHPPNTPTASSGQPTCLATPTTSSSSPLPSGTLPLSLPLELMVEPLRRRFKYHFMEDRKTNNLEKPEWYLTLVSNWLRDHTPILDKKVQPILEERGIASGISAKHEFGRGLLQEVMKKVEGDLPVMMQEDDSLMAHLIDELLLFDHELRTVFPQRDTAKTLSTPLLEGVARTGNGGVERSSREAVGSLSVMEVLLKEVPFDKWRNLEKSYAVERLREFTESPDAWSVAYETMLDADLSRVPHCTEQFMTLISEITDHYRYVSSVDHRLMFLELQVDLLLEFHCDLSSAVSKTHPLHPRYPAYLNASYFIHSVLEMWAQEQFFIDLWEHLKSPGEVGVAGGVVTSTPVLHGYQHLQEVGSGEVVVRKVREEEEENCCVFAPAMAAFKSLEGEMVGKIVEHVLTVARVNSAKYKTEKWHSMKDHNLQLMLQVSPGAADLLTSLREHLAFVTDHVSPLISPSLLDQVAMGVDSLLLSNVVLVSTFNESGVHQMKFDLEKYFIPMLAGVCDVISTKTLFERCREAIHLLQLPRGSACLLLEELNGAVPDRSAGVIGRLGGVVLEEAMTTAVDALNEMKVHSLSPQQALAVLQQRIYSD